MHDDLENSLGLSPEEILENCKKIMELRQNGLWEQIHGIVLPDKKPEND